jgi:serine/threonine protein kinase
VLATIGRYQLERHLGQGGMGDVYAAIVLDGEDRGQRVCVKMMKPALTTNPRAVDLFLREARHASRLRHDNIVRILELGRDGGTWFLAMELLDGLAWHDAAQRCWRHGVSLPLEVIVGATADAALALQYAHTLVDRDGRPMGIVHRDISPDNLFLGSDGSTRVLDFGIAKATTPDATSLTEMGELRGKLPYMPPEQVHTDAVDGAADIWALGITLFYLSTAQRPFDRATPMAIMKAIDGEPAMNVRELNPTLPPSFAAVVARCLQKNPRARWPSALALREALLALLPRPPDVVEARALLTHARSLPAGDRRPMTAYAAEPVWPAWASAATGPSSRTAAAPTAAAAGRGRADAPDVVTEASDFTDRERWPRDDDDPTRRHGSRNDDDPTRRHGSRNDEDPTRRHGGRNDRTTVTSPLPAIDERTAGGDDDGHDDGHDDGYDDSDGPGFEDARTIADRPVQRVERVPPAGHAPAGAPAGMALADKTVRVTVYASTAARPSSPSSELSATVMLPDAFNPRYKKAGRKSPGLPIWAYGAIAFGCTVVVVVALGAVWLVLR